MVARCPTQNEHKPFHEQTFIATDFEGTECPVSNRSGRQVFGPSIQVSMMVSGEANESLELGHHGLVCAPVNKIIKVMFDGLPCRQCLEPGQPPKCEVVNPRERFNRH
jgi:hypothetical protein